MDDTSAPAPNKTSRRGTLAAGLIGGLLGSALTIGGAYLIAPSIGDTGPAGPRGAQGPAGPAGPAPQTPYHNRLMDTESSTDLGGTYVIKGPLGCPDGSLPSRTVNIPSAASGTSETLDLCYIQP